MANMKYSDIIEDLEKTQEYKDWKENTKPAYLVHVFAMLDEANKDIYQIGYLNPKTDKIATFMFGRGETNLNPESEVLKDPEATIFPLDIDKVNYAEEDMLKNMAEFTEKTYPGIFPLKRFYILQHLDIGQVFNFTYLTKDFKTLNIKMDAETGEIKSHNIKELMKFD